VGKQVLGNPLDGGDLLHRGRGGRLLAPLGFGRSGSRGLPHDETGERGPEQPRRQHPSKSHSTPPKTASRQPGKTGILSDDAAPHRTVIPSPGFPVQGLEDVLSVRKGQIARNRRRRRRWALFVLAAANALLWMALG